MHISPSFHSPRTGNSTRTQAKKREKAEGSQPSQVANLELDWETGEPECLAGARLPQRVASARPRGRLGHIKDVLLMALGRDDEEDYECAQG